MPLLGTKGLASPEQTATGKDISNPFMAVMTCQKSYSSSTSYDSCSESGKWFQSSMDHPLSGSQGLASPEQTATAEVVPKSVAGSSFSAASSTYVVPTGKVVVPADRYIVHAGKVILIVSTGRLSLVPTGRVLSPGRVK
ncbi:hypothetical protein Tco_1254097 [Tanacetum coccineum]